MTADPQGIKRREMRRSAALATLVADSHVCFAMEIM
jgi:hypothetical protein